MSWSVRVLGDITASYGDVELAPRSPMARRVLAMLVSEVGKPVSTDRLIEALWPQETPADPLSTLHVHMSNLRKGLSTGDSGIVVTTSSGYLLDLPKLAVDAERFDQQVELGLADLAAGRWASASGRFGSALGEWAGEEPYAEFAYDDFIAHERSRLRHLRLDAREGLYLAQARLGQSGSVAELEGLVVDQPLRTRLWLALMLSLDNAGRGTEALRAFDRAVLALADVGLDPPIELRRIAERIADGSSRVDTVPQSSTLPRYSTSFHGRQSDVDGVGACLRSSKLVTITGPGGVGKTRLAVEVAQSDETDYSFVDLTSVGESGVSSAIAAALGFSGELEIEDIAEQIGGARIGILLDNCEHLLDSVPLGISDLMRLALNVQILATSRAPLQVPGETVWRLDPFRLEGDDLDAAMEMFAQRVGASDPSFRFDGREEQARDLLTMVDGLPLGIELAAASVPSVGLARSYRALRSHRRAGHERQRSMLNTVEWSWSLLPDEHRRMLALLSVFRSSFDLTEAAHVGELTTGEAEILVGDLVDSSLVVADHAHEAPYRILETIRSFAAERGGAGQAHSAVDRLTDLLVTAEDPPLAWLRRHEANLKFCLAQLRHTSDPSRSAVLATLLAQLWAEAPRPEDAEALISEVVSEVASGASSEIMLRLAEAAGDMLRSGAAERSVELWKMAIQLSENDQTTARLLRKVGELLADAGHTEDAYREAREFLERALEIVAVDSEERVRCQVAMSTLGYWTFDDEMQSVALTDAERAAHRIGNQDLTIRVGLAKASHAYQRSGYFPQTGVCESLEEVAREVEGAASAHIHFSVGFCLLAALKPEKALLHLVEAEERVLERGVISPWILAYRALAHRMLRETVEVRTVSDRLFELSKRWDYPMYRAVAHANRAWLASRNSAWDECIVQAEIALELWQDSRPPYIFQWTALLPLIRAGIELEVPGMVVDSASRLLSPEERRFPEDVTQALSAVESGQIPAARKALEIASRYGLH
ncbi:MAG: hypothetical protein DWQ40_12500 [Actinobacteria bacterium]|nr:MAG: hypothetical protein DWQ40_12500 [Actinomycetota bacterium]